MARSTLVFLIATALAALPVTVCGVLAAAQPAAVWIDVPFVRQPPDGCGAASVAMVMEYWARQEHRPLSAADNVASIQRQVESPRLHGATPAALERYLRRHGFLTFAVQGMWNDLQEQIGKGRPLIVALRPPGQRALHYVVIAGVDSARNTVTMNDPAQRKLLTQERAGFERDWSATHDWMLLALPQSAQR
jgi:predicted double-glycine peptidase